MNPVDLGECKWCGVPGRPSLREHAAWCEEKAVTMRKNKKYDPHFFAHYERLVYSVSVALLVFFLGLFSGCASCDKIAGDVAACVAETALHAATEISTHLDDTESQWDEYMAIKLAVKGGIDFLRCGIERLLKELMTAQTSGITPTTGRVKARHAQRLFEARAKLREIKKGGE